MINKYYFKNKISKKKITYLVYHLHQTFNFVFNLSFFFINIFIKFVNLSITDIFIMYA